MRQEGVRHNEDLAEGPRHRPSCHSLTRTAKVGPPNLAGSSPAAPHRKLARDLCRPAAASPLSGGTKRPPWAERARFRSCSASAPSEGEPMAAPTPRTPSGQANTRRDLRRRSLDRGGSGTEAQAQGCPRASAASRGEPVAVRAGVELEVRAGRSRGRRSRPPVRLTPLLYRVNAVSFLCSTSLSVMDCDGVSYWGGYQRELLSFNSVDNAETY